MGEAKPDTQRGWGKGGSQQIGGVGRERFSGPGRGWQLRGRDSSLGEGRQRAEDDVAEWEGKERQRQETSVRGTPGRQKPAPTETHRHPEWKRDSQQHRKDTRFP